MATVEQIVNRAAAESGMPTPGTIWRERDPRFTRFVKVLEPTSGWVRVRTWAAGEFVRGSRVSLIDLDAFHKRFTLETE